MAYYEFAITVPDTSREALLSKISEMGCLGVTDYGRRIIAYFKDIHDVVRLRDQLNSFRKTLEASGLDPRFNFEYLYLAERDWNESWKKKFVPVDVGKRLSILPPWETAGNERIPLIIDPGMAFGTGHHETTKTCLILIERYSETTAEGNGSPSPVPSSQERGRCLSNRQDEDSCPLPLREKVGVRGIKKDNFLDVGTGTGILSIAASKLGYRHIVGIDIDPLAIAAARRNADLNNLHNVVITEGGISDVEGTFDMIAANLMSEVLIKIAPEISSHLNDTGVALLSGMLVGQEAGVITAMEKERLGVIEKYYDGRWVSVTVRHL